MKIKHSHKDLNANALKKSNLYCLVEYLHETSDIINYQSVLDYLLDPYSNSISRVIEIKSLSNTCKTSTIKLLLNYLGKERNDIYTHKFISIEDVVIFTSSKAVVEEYSAYAELGLKVFLIDKLVKVFDNLDTRDGSTSIYDEYAGKIIIYDRVDPDIVANLETNKYNNYLTRLTCLMIRIVDYDRMSPITLKVIKALKRNNKLTSIKR